MKPKIEILTIGNELLEGRIKNTNVQYGCKQLYHSGYLVHHQCSVLDDRSTLLKQVETSLSRSDVVICSGGLGPTQDDITLEVVAEVFKSEFYVDQDLLTNLKKRYGNKVDEKHYIAFATVPKKASLMLDQLGMAPGYLFKRRNKSVILLPGVPYEFEHLIDHNVVPYLKAQYPVAKKEFKQVIHLCRVAESVITPHLEKLLGEHRKLRLGIYPHYGVLSLHFKVDASSQKEADLILKPCIKIIKKLYPKQWFDGKFNSIEHAVADWMTKKKLTLSTAESCSGGALSQTITSLSGASKYFKGSIVSYTNEAKQKLLKVKKSTLDKHGAVSETCIKEMAMGAIKAFDTDLALATSGIAGPTGGNKQKPVGLVWIAIASQNQILLTQKLQINGHRHTVIQRTVHSLLAELWINRDNIA